MNLSKRSFIPLLATLLIVPALAQTAETPMNTNHRYLVERTFPKGALDGLDATTKSKVNQGNATLGVTWIKSYANADKTKTYCVYEGPSEAAIRKAAQVNSLPIDSVVEVPTQLDPELTGQAAALQPAHRYFVERTFPKGAIDGITPAGKAKVNETNSKFGVKWVTSYANDDKTRTYCIYEGPSPDAIREAAKANGMNANTVTEIPETLQPK
jgi:hypothetical protein